MTAIRGAITVSRNTPEAITAATTELAAAITEKNGISSAVYVMISSTRDITAMYPATALRESGIINAPLFSCAEPDIEGSLKMCVRFLVLCAGNFEAKHVYLGEAKSLRKDLED